MNGLTLLTGDASVVGSGQGLTHSVSCTLIAGSS